MEEGWEVEDDVFFRGDDIPLRVEDILSQRDDILSRRDDTLYEKTVMCQAYGNMGSHP